MTILTAIIATTFATDSATQIVLRTPIPLASAIRLRASFCVPANGHLWRSDVAFYCVSLG